MAQLRVAAAARAVGKDRSTLNRYIKSGRLSVGRDASGATVIETAELLRVFGALHGDGAPAPVQIDAHPDAGDAARHVLEATLELLKEQLRASQEREARLLAMLEQEQQSRRELERRLPQGEVRALPAEESGSRGLLGRLLGKFGE